MCSMRKYKYSYVDGKLLRTYIMNMTNGDRFVQLCKQSYPYNM